MKWKNVAKVAVVAACLILICGCQRVYDERSLVCENQQFYTRDGYYSCCKVRELVYLRELMERMEPEQCLDCP